MPAELPVAWPGGASCAVALTFELDAELAWLALDPGATDRPKTLSIGEYGARRGARRILDVLDRHGVHGTWLTPGRNALTYPELVRELGERGHELGVHGFEHENFALLDRAAQRDVLLRAVTALETTTGLRPQGHRIPEGDMTLDTEELLVDLGFRWSSSTRGDDRPFMVEVGGQATDLVEIPAHWELDDFPYFMFNYVPAFPTGQGRIAPYADVLEYWCEELDAYRERGLCCCFTLHDQAIGTPGRIRILEGLLEHAAAAGDVWFATCGELADFWRAEHRRNDPGSPAQVLARESSAPEGANRA